MPSEARDKPPTVSGSTHVCIITKHLVHFNHHYQSQNRQKGSGREFTSKAFLLLLINQT